MPQTWAQAAVQNGHVHSDEEEEEEEWWHKLIQGCTQPRRCYVPDGISRLCGDRPVPRMAGVPPSQPPAGRLNAAESCVKAWQLTREKGDSEATAAHCTPDLQFITPQGTEVGLDVIKEKVFRTVAPPPLEGGLPRQTSPDGSRVVVERMSKVKFGFMAMAIRQEFELVTPPNGRPLISKIRIMKG